MFGKSWEFWAVIVGMAFYVVTRDAETESLAKRITKTLASALLAFGLSAEIAPYMGDNQIAGALCIMAFGLILLDLITALILDKDFIKSVIVKKVGGDQ